MGLFKVVLTCHQDGNFFFQSVVYSIVRLHWYSCPDLLAFCAHMCSSCSLLYSCLFPALSLILQLQVQSQFPASCVSVFVPRTDTIQSLPTVKNKHEPDDAYMIFLDIPMMTHVPYSDSKASSSHSLLCIEPLDIMQRGDEQDTITYPVDKAFRREISHARGDITQHFQEELLHIWPGVFFNRKLRSINKKWNFLTLTLEFILLQQIPHFNWFWFTIKVPAVLRFNSSLLCTTNSKLKLLLRIVDQVTHFHSLLLRRGLNTIR